MSVALEPAGAAFDYLFKFIILGESSTGKSTLLHQFIHHEFTPKSHTVGVEFTSRLLLLDPSSPNPARTLGGDDVEGGGWGREQEAHLRGRGGPSAPGGSRKASAVKLQIWDTAGQERFRSVTKSYYRAASGALLVYDVTKRSTFDNLGRWLADVRSLASENLVVAIVGNKTDLADSHGGSGGGSRGDGGAGESAAREGEEHDQEATNSPSTSSTPKREVSREEAAAWAASQGCLFAETSSLTGHNVEAPFALCARGVLDLIEQGIVAPEQQGSGVSYGDRSLRPGTSRSNSRSADKSHHRLSFADIVQSGGGVSRRAARGNTGGGLIRLKEAIGLDRDGGCC